MAIRQIGARGLLFTESELVCWRIYRVFQRRQLITDVLDWGNVFWPRLLRRLQWPEAFWLKLVQLLLVIAVWPLLLVGALIQMLMRLIWFPARFLVTFLTPGSLQAPGEKSLLGIHNAFVSASISSISLSEALYVNCVDTWIAQLYGAETAKLKNLNAYIEQLEKERSGLNMEVNLEASLRDEVVVARERLSRDLGHYLVEESKAA